MKKHKIFLCVLLIISIVLISFTGCGNDPDESSDWDSGRTYRTHEYADFLFSDDIDENGFWEGIRALNYVELFNYQAMPIPNHIHEISDEQIQNQINDILAGFTLSEYIMDRAVVDGDTVNIDFVGSVDGVEFAGGSTEGMGAYVIAGSTDYIDDFLTQIIGYMPGDTVNVEVTFPDNYGSEELNGKDALFITVINYIVEDVVHDLTDDFVAENLFFIYGWTTIDEMNEGVRADLQKNAIQQYIQQYFITEVKVKSIPEKIMKYQEKSFLNYYIEYADMYEMELDDFLKEFMGVSGVDELLESNHANSLTDATFSLVAQAIAEDIGISVSSADLTNYFVEYEDTDDYSHHVDYFGLPYLKQHVLRQMVLDYITERVILE